MSVHIRNASGIWAHRTGRSEYIYLHFPYLPITRLARQHQLDASAPICLYQPEKGVDRLVYLSEAAHQQGLSVGLSVPDARARLPDALFYPADHVADARILVRLARWAWCYSPRTGIDKTALGIWIDMTGASHLVGGCMAGLQQMMTILSQAGLRVMAAASPCYAASWALAHYHPDAVRGVGCFGLASQRARIVDILPVTALRLEADCIDGLVRSGLRTIGALRAIRPADLAMRFGDSLTLRLEQLNDDRSERLVALRADQPMLVTRHWPEPISGEAPVARMVDWLIDEMASLLMTQEQQARQFELGWQYADGNTAHMQFRLSRASNDRLIMHRLCADAASRIDAKFGIDYSWMRASGLVDYRPVTALLGTDRTGLAEIELDHMIDVLAARLGPEKVRRAIPRNSWHIEQSEKRVAVTDAEDRHHDWQIDMPAALSAPRPVRLLNIAEPITTISVLPDHPPQKLIWRKKHWKVTQASGPERIGPAWWQAGLKDTRSRDYYRLQLSQGPRIWVFREGLAERGDKIGWYMQGFFC
ncbi:MAG: Y-family DNA polymerase [Candidatus Puniceispirillaceae bacterium]|jgi:protein ImuB